MKQIELLSPVGDFECLKAAVQNGADSVYLGASAFNARINNKNFDLEELKKAITYAKLRNVKVFLTLNTLVTDSELGMRATTGRPYRTDFCNRIGYKGL